MAEQQVTVFIASFIAVAILLSVGVVILGNATNNCSIISDYRTPNFVASVTMTNVGVNYTSAPTVAFNGGGFTTRALGTAVLSGNTVSSVTITEPGEGYTTTPTVSFSGGGGVNAAGTAVMTTTQSGWAGACSTNATQTNSAYQLLGVVLIVIAAVIILVVIKYL